MASSWYPSERAITQVDGVCVVTDGVDGEGRRQDSMSTSPEEEFARPVYFVGAS